ncbi:ABC transporter substrate-binding protein [Peptococcaceae bacterium]|nr:ABC transporter substrate-binding protein [Peptococcaceae bacterium]
MKSKYSKLLILLLSIVTVAMFAFGCGEKAAEEKEAEQPQQQEQQAEALEEINVGVLRGPTVISMIKMFEDNTTIGDKVKVNYSVAEAPNIIMSRLLNGELDIATIPSNLAAKIYNKGVPYQIAAVSVWGVLYILSNGVEINSWSDLKEKEIELFGKGATPDILLRYLLKQNGIDPEKDVTLNYSIGPVELAQKMIAGKVKVAVVPQPLATMVMTKNKDIKQVLDFQEEWKRIHGSDVAIPQACLVVKKELAEKHPEIVVEFLREYEKSINWVNENPKEAGVLLEKHNTGMKAKLAEKAIPYCNIKYMDAIAAKPVLEEYYSILHGFAPESIGGKLPDEGFYFKK